MINYRINGDFYGNARSVIKGSEGFRGDIYSDTVSIPTIGYGYALIVRQRKSNGTMNYVVADYVQNEFASIGIAPTPAQMNLLRDIAIDLTNGNTAAARTKTATLDAQIRDIDQAEASTLFNRSLDRALADVKRGFIASLGSANGELLFTEMTGSTELVAISSMAFSGGSDIVGRSLSQALWNSNRAEAWYEIRYNSNNGSSRSPGIAKRRYYESELFGIYNNSASVQVDEAKEVFRMFSLHRSDIERYEQRYGVDFDGNAGWDRINGRPPLGAANYEFNLSGAAAVDAIHDALSPAWTALFAELQRLYPTGMAGLSATDFSPVNVQLDPNRNAGQPVTTNTQDHQSYLDGRRFNSQGQEISTRDVLIGEGGRDTLRGGLGDDVLIGGEGDDIYIYRAGDGNDRIIDSDRRGRVIVFDANGQHRELAAGAFFQQNPNGGTIWQSADGQISITHNSPWRLVLSDGSTIELGDFQDGDFGIDLINAPVPVDYTRT
ncbi:MAG: hypothetical protein HZC23_13310, partial [Rhodocyclales bacterium]|nr:hypothetical protein [Rhodocyclales bacterium]